MGRRPRCLGPPLQYRGSGAEDNPGCGWGPGTYTREGIVRGNSAVHDPQLQPTADMGGVRKENLGM